MGLTRTALIAVAALSFGCSTITALEAGPTVAFATRREPQIGAQAEARAGIGWSNRDALKTWGVEVSSKLKVTAATQNLAVGDGLYLARSTANGDLTAMVRGGLHLVVERFEDTLFVGGGPYAAIMVGVPIASRDYQSPGILTTSFRRERTLVAIGPAFELDARFARPSAVTFFGLAVGLAWSDDNLIIQPNLRLKPSDPGNTPPPY